MKSLTAAISGLIAGFLLGNLYSQKFIPSAPATPPAPPTPPPQPQIPEGMIQYKFFCWLCSGETNFACKVSSEEKHYNLECCRCGMDNKVKVEPKVLS